jgi:hypothetical protein
LKAYRHQFFDTRLFELAVSGDIKLSAKDLAKMGLDFEVKTERALDFSTVGSKGGAIFFKPERMRLKNEKREEIVSGHPELDSLTDENILGMIPPGEFRSETVNNIMEFTPVTMEDLDDILGEEEAVA